ncbi:MAG: hypothetical protein RLY86_2239 [Pseudomonadota bacterium]|jgi:hypothetical protein
MQAEHLDLRYEPVEDRLILTARGPTETLCLALTRRLARLFLKALVDLLLRTSDTAARASERHRNDVLLFEHVGALTRALANRPDPGEGTAEAAGALRQDVAQPSALLARVDLSARDGRLILLLAGADGGQATLSMPRDIAHQLLWAAYEKTRAAEWDFTEFAWIEQRERVVLTGASLS